MGNKIFISYRRADSAATCGRIYDRLVAAFGKDAVFKDVDAIGFGTDFRVAIRNALDQSAVQLVVIGPQWLDAQNAQGQRRLYEANDSVRFEIEYALQRRMIVIPVLVQGASVPPPQQLPPSLQQVSYLNASEVRYDPDFEVDVGRLVGAIGRTVPGLTASAPVAASGRVDPTPRIARQPAKLGTLLRWGLAFGVPLAFVEALLMMTAATNTHFFDSVAMPWLVAGMLVLALAEFFVVGLFVARRTGEIGSGFLTVTAAAIITGLIASFVLAWSDSVQFAAAIPQYVAAYPEEARVQITNELVGWTPTFVLGGTMLGIAASAIGGAIGKRIKPPSVEQLARSRIVLRVGVIAGLLLAVADGIIAYNVSFMNSADATSYLWLAGIITVSDLFLAGLFAARGTRSIGFGVLASLLTGIIAGLGVGLLGAWGANVRYGTSSYYGNYFVAQAGAFVLLFGLVGIAASFLPGVIGGAVGQSIRPKVPAQTGVPAR